MSTIKKVVFFIKDFFKRADMFLFTLCFLCACFSIYAVYIATLGMQAGGVIISPTKNVIVQIFSIVVGVGAFVIFTVIDADILGSQWRWLCVINVALMVALVLFGSEGESGSRSWIRFAGIGVQPSEIVKVLYIIVSARQMTYLKEHRDINAFLSVAQIAAHFVLVFGMIVVVGDDLGSGTIILALFLLMFFAAGVKLYWFAIGGAAVAAVIPILWNYFLKDYQKQRLIAPYDKSIDPDGWGITWQTTQSRYSLMAGRMTGAEADHRATVFTGKHTDFIFASIGEHLGMIGCIFVILMLTIIIVRCVYVGLHAGRMYDMLICIGVAGALAFQTFINIGMCIGVTPVIGIPLPFFSYGGSSMVTLFAAVGLVSGVHYKPKPEHFSMIY
ncbi:MAG: FtsW/RodA/SpoVE family cell cycle protein [Firmicutes bacterium]|nr:FtsW/RodA/SpoVE family cell cycle protein [Bacillota bacterium]